MPREPRTAAQEHALLQDQMANSQAQLDNMQRVLGPSSSNQVGVGEGEARYSLHAEELRGPMTDAVIDALRRRTRKRQEVGLAQMKAAGTWGPAHFKGKRL